MSAQDPSANDLRELARSFVAVARDRNLDRLTSELSINGRRVEVTIERPVVGTKPGTIEDDDGASVTVTETVEDVRDEHVTVKVGPKTRPSTTIAAPAAWLA